MENLSKILSDLITLTLEARSKNSRYEPEHQLLAWLREYSTVWMKSGRRVGHSTAIKDVLQMFKGERLILTLNCELADQFFDLQGDITVCAIPEIIKKVRGSSRIFSAVFVDNASYVSEDIFNVIESLLPNLNEQSLIVLVG